MGFAAEGRAPRSVFGDEVIENGLGLAVVEALFCKHRNDPGSELLKVFVQLLLDRPVNEPVECDAGHIVSSWALGLSVGIAELLLSLPLFEVADLLGLCWHALFPVRSLATDARRLSPRQRRLHGIGNPGL